ncbi:MAG: hypothetical protein ABI134_02435 [Byssovorax sp.]
MKRDAVSIAVVLLLSGCDWDAPPALWSGAAVSGSGGSTASSSGSGGSGGSGGAVLACTACEPVQETGTLASLDEIEISGLVASLAHDGVFYVHNDSGDSARFFAIDLAGKALATFTVSGATAIDWEDIARAPCPAGTCLFLGDIGDNGVARSDCAVYRVTEPATIADATVPAEKLPFSYPDGPHNAETLLADPATGGLFIVTKTLGISSVYAFPLPLTPGKSVVLTRAGDISLPILPALVTGGDVHPLGRGVLLRTYADVWLFPQAPGMSVVDALVGAPCAAPSPPEAQGEAIGWLASGAGYVTTSEGKGSAIHRVACAMP